MNSTGFLYAAYIATWLIHGLYIGMLVRRNSRMRQQMKELNKSGK
jgi:CcmD family protein